MRHSNVDILELFLVLVPLVYIVAVVAVGRALACVARGLHHL